MTYSIGDMRLFAGNFPPRGWAFCDGALLSTTTYPELFSLLGTNFGGDGSTNFALPDFRGRVPIGTGAGPGLTPQILGEQRGEAQHTLTVAELPVHNHGVNASTLTATDTIPSPGVITAAAVGDVLHYNDTAKPTDVARNFSAKSIQAYGAANPVHNNLMPSLAMNFIISLEGIYPSQ